MGIEQDVMVIPEPERKKNRFTGKTLIVIFFVGIVGALVYYALGGTLITGNFIGGGDADPEDKFPIFVELGLIKSELSFNQGIGRIYIEPKDSKKEILVGKVGTIKLDEIENPEISIEGFVGRINFDNGNIRLLEGSADKVVVNGIPTASAGEKIAVAIDGSLPYDLLELEGVYLKEYEDKVSGKIVAKERTSFVLVDESVLIEDFFGNMRSGEIGNYGISKKGFVLEGDVERLEIDGELKVDLGN